MNLLKSTKGKIVTAVAGTAVVAAVVVGVLMTKEESFRTVAVEELNGTTIVTTEGKEADAYEGMHLYSGDDVKVQQESDMTLVMDMDKYVYAEPGTHFWLECAGSADKSETVIHLEEGSVLNRIKDNLNAGEVYQVDTPNSTMAVRGTVFRVTVYRGEDGLVYTDLEVFEGEVQVDLKTEDGEYNGVSETFGPGESALIRGNSDFSEFVTGEGNTIKLPIDYKKIPQGTAKKLVFYIEDGEVLCIEEELLKDYTTLEEHKMERVTGQDATCTEDGYEEVVCTVCKEVTETIVLPALGHTSDEWVIDTEATCEADGHRHKVCTVCGENFEEETIAALGHISSAPVVTAAATCTTPGMQSIICERCGQAVENIEIPALGHTPGAWQTTVKASCTSEGTQVQICSVCNEVVATNTIAATGHKWGSWHTEREATCTSNGEKYKTCSVCGDSRTRVTTAGGHTGEWTQVVEATCESTGREARTCTSCGTYETRDISATGHALDEWQDVEDVAEVRDCTKKVQIRNCENENCTFSESQTVASGTEHQLIENTLQHSFSPNNDGGGTLIHEQQCGNDGCDGIYTITAPTRLNVDNAEVREYWCDGCGDFVAMAQ